MADNGVPFPFSKEISVSVKGTVIGKYGYWSRWQFFSLMTSLNNEFIIAHVYVYKSLSTSGDTRCTRKVDMDLQLGEVSFAFFRHNATGPKSFLLLVL